MYPVSSGVEIQLYQNVALQSRVSDFTILGHYFLSITIRAVVQITSISFVSFIFLSHTSDFLIDTTDILSHIILCCAAEGYLLKGI